VGSSGERVRSNRSHWEERFVADTALFLGRQHPGHRGALQRSVGLPRTVLAKRPLSTLMVRTTPLWYGFGIVHRPMQCGNGGQRRISKMLSITKLTKAQRVVL
jgi:hypothetical protein